MEFKTRNNLLHYYVDILRGKRRRETGEALHNIIRTMCISRDNSVCGEDFSNLDFGSIPFNGIHFSLGGKMPTCFNKCILKEQNFMSGHFVAITAVSWSSNGGVVATASKDGTIILWNVNSGLMVHKLEGHTDEISSVTISTDGKYCLSGSLDKTAKL